ncbi:type II toxin-antitoxin system RelE/ParE family toxin [Streptosporangium sp. OZ121]|uniref:type II toxin-antitoxin system RelE/ParE family toxin n=1 Tax=Streptosporangium sp. OZ121 TaxID=3444183 RepID=UPI003F7AFC81
MEDEDLNNLKELRPGLRGRSEIRIIFDPDREAVFLVAGDKAGKWSRWYDEAIPLAKSRYTEYRAEKKAEQTKEDRR